jgi:hypothetical protein
MAQQPTNSAGTSAGRGQKKRDTFIALVILGFLLLTILWGFKLGWFTDQSASETQARSGMYIMYDQTDESVEGAPNRKKSVQISFTPGRMDFDFSVVLDNGLKTKAIIGGTTLDGVHYLAKFKREDEDSVDADEWICTFKERSGHCDVPNIAGGTNRMMFTKE